MRALLVLARVEQMGRPLFEIRYMPSNDFSESHISPSLRRSLISRTLSDYSDEIARAVSFAEDTNPGCMVTIRVTVSFMS